MAKKATEPTGQQLIDEYMEYVLLNGKRPHTIYHFMKEIKADEGVFYKYFSSFDHLEKMIFKAFMENTIELIEKNPEYKKFDSREKLLTFYYTFFEMLTANRSYVMSRLKESGLVTQKRLLSEMRKVFLDYVASLDINAFNLLDRTSLANVKNKTVEEVAWMQLVVTLKFYLGDESENFEKTDVFIEKSINAGFEIISELPFQKVMDFGKFLLKERMNVQV